MQSLPVAAHAISRILNRVNFWIHIKEDIDSHKQQYSIDQALHFTLHLVDYHICRDYMAYIGNFD